MNNREVNKMVEKEMADCVNQKFCPRSEENIVPLHIEMKRMEERLEYLNSSIAEIETKLQMILVRGENEFVDSIDSACKTDSELMAWLVDKNDNIFRAIEKLKYITGKIQL